MDADRLVGRRGLPGPAGGRAGPVLAAATRTLERDEQDHLDVGEYSYCSWVSRLDRAEQAPYLRLTAMVRRHRGYLTSSPIAMAVNSYRSDHAEALTPEELTGLGDEAHLNFQDDAVLVAARRANVTVSIDIHVDSSHRQEAKAAARAPHRGDPRRRPPGRAGGATMIRTPTVAEPADMAGPHRPSVGNATESPSRTRTDMAAPQADDLSCIARSAALRGRATTRLARAGHRRVNAETTGEDRHEMHAAPFCRLCWPMGRTLIVTRGLPASGKSTEALRWVAEDPERRARVGSDQIAAMLHPQMVGDRVRYGPLYAQREQLVVNTAIEVLLRLGIDVVCDDPFLLPGYLEAVRELAERYDAELVIVDLTDVDVEECIARDAHRARAGGQSVGEQEIRRQHQLYHQDARLVGAATVMTPNRGLDD